jgi:uncharacterized protein YjbJ (UPF0337 family)
MMINTIHATKFDSAVPTNDSIPPFLQEEILHDIIMEPLPRERTFVDEVEGVLKEAIGYVCGWSQLEKEGKALNKASNPIKQLADAKKRLHKSTIDFTISNNRCYDSNSNHANLCNTTELCGGERNCV